MVFLKKPWFFSTLYWIDSRYLQLFIKNKKEQSQYKIVEIKINVPGNDLFVKEQAESFEIALDRTVNVMKKLLIRHKEKLQAY